MPEAQTVQTACRSSARFFNPFGCFALRFPAGLFRISLVRSLRDTNAPPLRNFDTEPHSSHCYEAYFDNRLESAANAHTAADLHVRPGFSNRAGLKSRGRRERPKRYSKPCFPQRK
jgi:hypothetical protein